MITLKSYKYYLFLSISIVLVACTDRTRQDLVLLNEGKKLFFDSQFLGAKNLFEESSKINPRNDVSLAYLGFCNYHLENYSDAIIQFNKSLKLNATNNIALFGKSLVLLNMDELLGSYILLDSVCKINPTHDKAFYYKASVELKLGDTLNALKNIETAIHNAENYVEPYYLLSSIYLNQNLEKKADSLLLIARKKKIEMLESP